MAFLYIRIEFALPTKGYTSGPGSGSPYALGFKNLAMLVGVRGASCLVTVNTKDDNNFQQLKLITLRILGQHEIHELYHGLEISLVVWDKVRHNCLMQNGMLHSLKFEVVFICLMLAVL